MASFDNEIYAINAALKLKESIQMIIPKWTKVYDDIMHKQIEPLALKCGMNTGDVLFGSIETGDRYEVTSLGPIVNLASRLEDKATNNQIIVSKEIVEKINSEFIIRPINLPEDKRI